MNIICALHAEAKVFIQNYGMKQCQEDLPFPIFLSSKHALIISGISSIQSAAATAYLAAFLTEKGRVKKGDFWVNVGLCAYGPGTQGQVLMAKKISHAHEKSSFYPSIPMPLRKALASLEKDKLPHIDYLDLCSYSHVVHDYPKHTAVDMEAYGFYQTMQRMTSVEWIHCIKVVSDSCTSPLSSFSLASLKEKTGGLMKKALIVLDTMETYFRKQWEDLFLEDPRYLSTLDAILDETRFSSCERISLEKVLRDLCSMAVYLAEEDLNTLSSLKDSKKILKSLEERKKSLNYSPSF